MVYFRFSRIWVYISFLISDPALHGETECETFLWDGLHRLPTWYTSIWKEFLNWSFRALSAVFANKTKQDQSFEYLFAQVCFVMIESLSHTTDDLIFKWNFTNPLYVSPEIQLPQVEYSKVYHRLDIRSCAIFSTFIVSFCFFHFNICLSVYIIVFLSPNQFQLELEQAKTEDCTIEYSTGTFTCLAAVFKMRRNPGRDRASLLLNF